MIGLLAAELREGDFQAAWFLAIVVAAMLALALTALWWISRGVRRVWRGGDRGPALVIVAATTVGMCFFIGMLIAASVALLRRSLG